MLTQKLRLQNGWSQEDLSTLSGVSTRTIQRIENGQSASPESLKAIAAVFDIHFNELRNEPMTDQASISTSALGLNHAEALALSKVRQIKGFYLHAVQFVVLVSVMVVVNIMTETYPWVLWVILGWGSGLLIHALRVYNKVPFFDAAWEKRKTEELLQRKL